MLIDVVRNALNSPRQESLRSIWKKSLLVLESATVAGALTVMWYVSWKLGWHHTAEAEVRASTVILVQLGLLGFIAAVTIMTVVNRSAVLSECIRKKDLFLFMTLRDIRIPVRMHLLFAVLAAVMLWHLWTLPYESAWEGFQSMFGTSFSLIFYFSITMELQDPHRSTWFKTKTPDGWLKMDAETYFRRLHALRQARARKARRARAAKKES